MTDALSGLDLRKALCEALGWCAERLATKHGYRDWWHAPACPRSPCMLASTDCAWALPALESDPAQFWPEFRHWVKSNNFAYAFYYEPGFTRQCEMSDRSKANKEKQIVFCGYAETEEEAGCRAWLQAMEQLRKI